MESNGLGVCAMVCSSHTRSQYSVLVRVIRVQSSPGAEAEP